MASTYSPNLGLELMATGEDSGTWGTKTNTNLSPLLETSIVGVSSVVYASDADKTLTITNGTDSAGRYFTLVCTGTISATRKLICPLVNKTYLVVNTTTGGQSLNVIGASGTGTIVPNGTSAFIYCDGTNYNQAITGFNDLKLAGTMTAAAANFSGAQTNTVAGVPYQWTGNGAAVYPSFTSGGAVEYNFSNGNAEVDFWNTANSPTQSFMWRQQTGASSNTTLMTLSPAGFLGIGMTPSNVLDITKTQNTGSWISLLNASSGAGAVSGILLGNNVQNYETSIIQTGSAYTPSGLLRADALAIYSYGAGGLTLNTIAAQPIYFGINNAEAARIDSSGNLRVGTTAATGRLNIGGGSIYNSTSGVFNTAGPVSITIPGDTDGFILLNSVQNGVGEVSYIVHYMNVSGTVTCNTVSTLVTGTSPITAITPGTNVITLTLFAANTNVNWGMYNGPRG